jgi:hypothetical protein
MFTDAPCSSQLILGIDRRNPLFAVYQDLEREQLHVYYGFELLSGNGGRTYSLSICLTTPCSSSAVPRFFLMLLENE